MEGYQDGTYRPDATINRAELTKIIMATNLEASQISSCNVGNIGLSDVPSEAWFAPYVCTARVEGVIEGYPDGTFKPAQNVTFVEAAKIISLGFGQNLAPDPSLWYKPYVDYLSAQSAIPESIDAVAKNITRGEMAEIIYRLHAAVQNRPAQAFQGEQLVPMTDEIREQQQSNQSQSSNTTATNTSTTTQTTATNTTTTSSGNTGGTNSGPRPAPRNPLICQSCPAGTIGHPSNNCACETAYLYEHLYPIQQCEEVQFTCSDGYEYFADETQCGCKLKEEVIEYWLFTDPDFKLNALDERPPIVHGTYEDLTPSSLEAALGVKNMVLFFHASWCPTCAATDLEIKDRITELPADAVIFKTDYDTEITLRDKFEIASQHSIVIIDKNNALQFKQTGFTFDDIISVLEKMAEGEASSQE